MAAYFDRNAVASIAGGTLDWPGDALVLVGLPKILGWVDVLVRICYCALICLCGRSRRSLSILCIPIGA